MREGALEPEFGSWSLSASPCLLRKLSGLHPPWGWRETAAAGRPGEGLPRLPRSTSPLCSAGSAPELWGGHMKNLTLGPEWTLAPQSFEMGTWPKE